MAKKYEDYDDENEETEEEYDDREAIKSLKKQIISKMNQLDPTSQEYMVLAQRLADITECARNEAETIREEKQAAQLDSQKYAWILPTVCQTAGTIVGQITGQLLNRRTVNDVLRYEDDGNILNSRSTAFIQKPRN